jgi:release factor glutamine methyltransferase
VVLAALPEGGALLDLGTGSGNIAVAVADERPDVSVVAVDASPGAIELARANVDALVPGRVELFVSDLYAAVPAGRVFDVVAGNLPYVEDNDTGLESQVAKHEPALALYGGPDGLGIIRRAVGEVHVWLRAGGTMVLECGGAQEDLVGDVMRGAGLVDVRTARDLAGIERVVYARRPAGA